MTTRKWPWVRIVAGVLASALLCFAILMFFECADTQRRNDEARRTDLIHWKVDLSKQGEYKGEFRHNYGMAHAQYVAIVTEPSLTSSDEAKAILEGLRGSLSVVDSSGGVVYETPFNAEQFDCREMREKNWLPAVDFGHFDRGRYELRLVVEHGAPRLSGVSQTLVARYFLCGMEQTVVEVMWLFGVGACTIAGILVLVIVTITIKKRCGNAKQGISPQPSP
jgi:hypothetical protein